jgi:sulfate transport system permease protein
LRPWSKPCRVRHPARLLTAAIAVPLSPEPGGGGLAIPNSTFPTNSYSSPSSICRFSASPVIAGLIYVLVFGAQSWFGPASAHTR